MAIHTVHLILGVLIMNAIFGVGFGIMNDYENGKANMSSNLSELVQTSDSMESNFEATIYQVDGNGMLDKSGVVRDVSGTSSEYAESALNLGSQFDLMTGLGVQAMFPTKIGETIQRGITEENVLLAIGYWIISLLILGINLMLYKRIIDIMYSKMHN